MLRRWCRFIYTGMFSHAKGDPDTHIRPDLAQITVMYSAIAMTTTSVSTVLISTFCAPCSTASQHVQIFACLPPSGYKLAYFGKSRARCLCRHVFVSSARKFRLWRRVKEESSSPVDKKLKCGKRSDSESSESTDEITKALNMAESIMPKLEMIFEKLG